MRQLRKTLSSTLLSCIIWGSGQFFICKQKVKGLLLFAAQVLLFGIELGTGYWFNYFAGQISDFQLRLYGGYFTKGVWGLITLGTVPRKDHSAVLMINGIVSVLVLIFFLAIYIFNIRDAYLNGELLDDIEDARGEDGVRLHSGESIVSDFNSNFRRKMFPYLMLIPAVFAVVFILFMPIVFSILTAFTNYDMDHMPPASLFQWVGLENFLNIIHIPVWTTTFLRVLLWTVIWTVSVTFLTYFLGLFQALILSSKYVRFKSFFRAIFILPWAIPGMISLLVFRNLFNSQFGPINQFLMDIGLIQERIKFLTDPTLAKITIIIVNVWLGFPCFMVMLLGVLSNQDPTLYEAATIDGASRFQIFSKIKLPLLLKATMPLIVINLASNFNAFSSIYFLTSGGPSDPDLQFAGDTDILISWIYKLTLDQKMYSMAAVMNLLLFIFIGVVSYLNFRRTTSYKEI